MKLSIACALAGSMLLAFGTAAQEKTEYSIDNTMSKLEINVYKAGLFKAFGHDHLIAAGEISGRVQLDAQKLENSSVLLKVGAKSLTVVDPGESEKDRHDVQATMMGEQVLDATRFSEIVFSSKSVTAVKRTADGWSLTVDGKLDLHGAEKQISLPLTLRLEGGQLVARGAVALLQSQFGIKPVSIGGGSVKVKDELKVGFAIVANRVNP
jgi:polyisoprenoid-binding protein YceI